jgi:hypothetical protein
MATNASSCCRLWRAALDRRGIFLRLAKKFSGTAYPFAGFRLFYRQDADLFEPAAVMRWDRRQQP